MSNNLRAWDEVSKCFKLASVKTLSRSISTAAPGVVTAAWIAMCVEWAFSVSARIHPLDLSKIP